MRKIQLVFLSALLAGGLGACMNQSVDPSSTYYDQNDADIKTYATTKGLSGTTTTSGLFYTITSANPTAKKATIAEELEFEIKLYNLKDVVVDSTKTGSPIYFLYGLQGLPAGLNEGLGYMREGEKATFLAPSYLAYGNQAYNANLPAYSVVRYDVKLNRSRTEPEQINDYIKQQKLVVTDSSATGLKFIKTQANPTGATPTAGQTFTVRYKGKLLRSASAFDSTGTGTFDFKLGQSIRGFDEGLAKLKVGEKATILFPSSIGYGTTGNGPIPPYTPLRFDIELVSAK